MVNYNGAMTGTTISWTPTDAVDYVFSGTWEPALTVPVAPHPRFREYLESAARKLGPERCEQALRSFDGRTNADWHTCALACAYGEDGALMQQVPDGEGEPGIFAAKLLGLTYREVLTVMNCYDGCWGKLPRELLHAMLTLEAAKMMPTPTRVAAHV